MSLFHFTCDHGRRGIGRRGLVRPNPHTGIAWFTSNPSPSRDDVGLTSESLLTCDRLSFRYVVEQHDAEPWFGSSARESAEPDLVADLEAFGDPATWFVSTTSSLARLDRTYHREQEAP